jgi:hypothetical protein
MVPRGVRAVRVPEAHVKVARVFAVVPDCHVEGWRFGALWRTHFYDGLRSTGADVILPQGIRFDWARPPQHVQPEAAERARKTSSEALLRQIQETAARGLDVVVSYCFSNDIELEVVDEVRSAGIPWINFFCDSAYAFHTVEALARRTSLNWFVESESESRYRELGVRYLRAPYALNPAALPDASCTHPERLLAFVGTAHRDRVRMAMLFRLGGVDLHVRGWGWQEALEARDEGGLDGRSVIRRAGRALARRLLRGRIGGHLDEEEYVTYLRSSRAVLGMNEGYLPGKPPIAYLKLRDLELPGMGCAYLVQHHDDLEHVFDVGREVRSFRTMGEGRRVVRELARDPEGCRRMGLLARERVLAEHSWSVRLPQLIEAL